MAEMNKDQIEDMLKNLRDISLDTNRMADAMEKIAEDIGSIAVILNHKETN